METNESEVIVDPNNEEVVETEETQVEETTQEVKTEPEKVVETPEQKVARLRRQLKQAEKQAGVNEPKPSKKSDDLDYGQKAYLVANGIKGSDEVQLVKDIVANTGKSLDEVLDSKYFQAELKEMRDAKLTENAVPNGSKRAGQSAQSTVEYWLAKGELPPASERELRQKVVNARIKAESNANIFTQNAVVK